MSKDAITPREFKFFVDSTQAAHENTQVALADLAGGIKELVKQGVESQKYFIRNDYQHQESKKRLTNLAEELNLLKLELKDFKKDSKADFSTIAAEFEIRKPAFLFFNLGSNTVKFIVVTFVVAVISVAGKSTYEAMSNKIDPLEVKTLKDPTK